MNSNDFVRFLEAHPEMEDAPWDELARAFEDYTANEEAARIDWCRMVAKEGRWRSYGGDKRFMLRYHHAHAIRNGGFVRY
jgi:hypothetical protein